MAKLVTIERCRQCQFLYPKINNCQHPDIKGKKVRDIDVIPVWCPMYDIFDRIAFYRQEMQRLNISHREAAEYLGISKSHLTNILNRKNALSLAKIRLFKKMLEEKEQENG